MEPQSWKNEWVRGGIWWERGLKWDSALDAQAWTPLSPLPAQSAEMSPWGKPRECWCFEGFSERSRLLWGLGPRKAAESTSKPTAVWSISRAGVLVSLDKFWSSKSKNSSILLAQEKTLRFFTKVKAQIKTFSAWQGKEGPTKLKTGLCKRCWGQH